MERDENSCKFRNWICNKRYFWWTPWMNEIMVNGEFGRHSEKYVIRPVIKFTLEKNAEFSKLE